MPPSSANFAKIKEIDNVDLSALSFADLIEAGEPVILKGAFADKAMVQAGLESARAAMDHIQQYKSALPVVTFTAEPEHRGRFFYNSDMTGMNFESRETDLDAFFASIEASDQLTDGAAFYAGSTDMQTFFPGMIEGDNLSLSEPVFDQYPPIVSIWMGNRTTAAIHYDMSHNIAACMVGKRRFTLFPPEQIDNLYPGPLFPTPAGQVVSMVNLHEPDLEQYPRFARALDAAQVAELEPGDLLVYPAMWWHQVDALDDFNVLINYWWNAASQYLDSPMNTVLHAMLSLRDRSMSEKEAWKEVFDYYIFGDGNAPREHLPDNVIGPLGPMDDQTSRRLRIMLLQKLNR